jgi:hypothetical protein
MSTQKPSQFRNSFLKAIAKQATFGIALLGMSLPLGMQAVYSQTPPNIVNSNVIQACVDRDGKLKIVPNATACRKDQQPLNWNIEKLWEVASTTSRFF